MTYFRRIFSITAATMIAATGYAQAGEITYSDFSHEGTSPVNYLVTVDDNTAGKFTITFGVASGSPNTTAKFTGIYFDVGDSGYDVTNLGLTTSSSVSLFNPPASVNPSAIAFDADQIAGDTNLNLGDFDVVVAFKGNNSSTLVDLSPSGRTASFQINTNGYALADWGRVGMRGQAVGTSVPGGGGSSAKEIQNAPDLTPVPIPAAAWLFGSALAGMVGVGARRNRRANAG